MDRKDRGVKMRKVILFPVLLLNCLLGLTAHLLSIFDWAYNKSGFFDRVNKIIS